MGPELMLATPTSLPVDVAAVTLMATGLWSFELKLDGIRAAVTLNRNGVRITNRYGVDITARFPDVVESLAPLDLNVVLDGEIVVLGRDGRPDFAAVHRRNAQSKPRSIATLARSKPATFVSFDVLFINGLDVRRLTYVRRRQRLEQLGAGKPLRINPRRDDGAAMWAFVRENDLEGLVLKRNDSPYEGGRRSPLWVKVKATHRLSAVVSGFDPGKGSLAGTFGALHLALIESDGRLRPVGSVGTGFRAADRRAIWNLIQQVHGGGGPIIAEVEYLEVSPTGHLRNPSFKGVRLDLTISDCSVEQLRAP